MRFADLNPSITQSPLTGYNCIVFDCPSCGKPYRISIQASFRAAAPPAQSIWCWDYDAAGLVTISPSINNAVPGHGRKKRCSFHGSVVRGEVVIT